MITIEFNGEPKNLAENNLQEAINILQLDKNNFAIAINEQFIPRSAYANTELQSGDRVELLVPMQGG